jgi:DNA-binding NtrC family response regulator
VREHGGDIEIHSQVGVGTEVSIGLPAYSPLSPLSAPQATFAKTDETRPSRRFLIVDDEAEIAELLQKILVRAGSSADTAADMEQAFTLATTNEYDFIVTDVKMPGGSGIDLYKKLCARIPSYRRRFVFLTGDTSNPSTMQFFEKEGVVYFAKPFDFRAMETFLRESEIPAARG